jgi:predicted dehydrogenase
VSAGPVGVGLIGAGVISDEYLRNLTSFPDVRVHFVADIDVDRARSQAATYGVPGAGTVQELLDRDEVEIVVNLTIPAVHAEVARRALDAGKHVWSEKPLALDRESAQGLLDRAQSAGLRLACAPDTVLGPGIQTALRAIRNGLIGTPLSATTMMLSPGPESWHPNPAFLFARGAGPVLDIGPYYITTLVAAMGPVAAVAAAAGTAFATRSVGSGPLAGTEFPVEVPTHYGVLLRFENGASAQSTFSFQSALQRAGFVEITGTEGVLVLPDPNVFDGATTLHRRGCGETEVLEPVGAAAGRGTGVVDLARSIRAGLPERASGELASHVLDVMLAVGDAAETDAFVPVASRPPQPQPLAEDWDPFEATLAP